MTDNTTQLSYAISGSGETVVLVHGSWSDRNNWLPVAGALARSHRVVACDRRGHGLSRRDVAGTRADQENDLAALIERVGDGPAHVVGTSFGGSIALGLAARRPELVHSLVVHEPPLLSLAAGDPDLTPRLAAVQASVEAVVTRAQRGDARGAARQFVEEVALGPGAWDLLPEPLRQTMVDSAPAFLAEQRDPDWAAIQPAALARIAAPVLLTQGTASPAWFRPIVAKLATGIDRGEVHTYEGAGHAPHLTHPREYLATVTEFLARRAVATAVAAG